MTNREVVDRINHTFRGTSKDGRIADRYILNVAQTIAETYLANKSRSFNLHRQDDLFTILDCFEMKRDKIVDCPILEFRRCDKLVKSKSKLPTNVSNRLGNSIIEVGTVDGSFALQKSTIQQYRRDKIRGSKEKYFYVVDGYLYIPDVDWEVVRVVMITTDPYEADALSACCDECKSAWDYDFIAPGEVTEQVIREAAQQVSVMIQIPSDENPNMDSNQKSQTQ